MSHGVGADGNLKFYRAKVDSQFNPSGFDVNKILDGIFPAGLRPSFGSTVIDGDDSHASPRSPVQTDRTRGGGSAARVVVSDTPHLSPTLHSFIVTNEAGTKTNVTCLVWLERFARPTLEFILNDTEIGRRFEEHLDADGDDNLRHDFEVCVCV